MSQPKYSLPPKFIFKVLAAILQKQKRSFRADAHLAFSAVHPPIQVLGGENIPVGGPCLILMNHYSRPGYMIIWSAFAIASLLPVESRWLMTSAWTSPNKFWDPFKRRLTSILFNSIIRVYGFIPMPPMPPDPHEVAQRANAVRSLISLARQQQPIAIGLAPEGRDFPHARLGWPPPGTGRLLEQLSKSIPLLIPVGVYEDDCRQVLHFGPPLTLQFSDYASSAEKDNHLAGQVMGAIAELLPQSLRGDFS
jgi:1-acyl-sn-glycerol-3-phosphate acyltransferase